MPSKEDPHASPPPQPLLANLIAGSTVYAGIGSRRAPPDVLSLIREIATMLAQSGLTLRSGGAPGADTAFEAGCDAQHGKKEIFLPWVGFNGNPSPLFTHPPKALEIAALVHPRWRAVRPRDQPFHARNVQQIYGLCLTRPVDFVLFWAPEEMGSVQGGTATAANLARAMSIPTFNLRDTATLDLWQSATTLWQQRSPTFLERLLAWSKAGRLWKGGRELG